MLEIVKQKIRESEQTAITYHDYIETVLYYPNKGYYMKEQRKIGKQGDFYTSANVSNILAKKFAHFFIQLVESGVVPAHIREVGGGSGKFAHDILQEWKKQSPQSFSELRYEIIEASPYHRALQKQILEKFVSVRQINSIDLTEDFIGITFSNELFDAFPVHVIEKQNNRLFEVYITLDETDQLSEALFPLQNQQIYTYLDKHNLFLHNGQRFEVPLFMGQYIKKLGERMKQGLLVTVDYGYTNREWMLPFHQQGSLRGYYKHSLVTNPLDYPGEMDITTHIHWDELLLEGIKNGFELIWHSKQHEFLLAAGVLQDLVDHKDPNPFSENNKQNRAIRSMILSESMSPFFDVVVQQKGLLIEIESYLDTTMVMR
ncbi:SAM-dependent methyltransferase [Bacillus sp. 165]|uniref:class I SAM-dependent methyltransferase n=1 Tax=Bacillus sp. 165 TaxID=1529117 RepID=UPI001ADD4DCE|nr:SAM-dependent methyltransferase [Bacillus sp. 165]MBO9129643.1 SAM-dependent methyltransferase [Bacillus sp. 165]